MSQDVIIDNFWRICYYGQARFPAKNDIKHNYLNAVSKEALPRHGDCGAAACCKMQCTSSNMASSFRRRVGAAADVSELEYVAALHQTSTREDATVSSLDVCRFLKSRWGLDVPHKEGIRIVQGLGGRVAHGGVSQRLASSLNAS